MEYSVNHCFRIDTIELIFNDDIMPISPKLNLMTTFRIALATTLLCISASFPAFGSAPVHGAKAAGMSTAFTAVADDPSAILHNPAGITQLNGTLVYGGVTAIMPDSSYRNPNGETADTQIQAFFPPHLFITHSLDGTGVTVGLGIFSPFGIGGRKWPAEGPTRYIATENTIGTVALNPVLAIKIRTTMSIAFGIDYMRAQNIAKNSVDQKAAGASDGHMEIDAQGGGWGYNLGLLWKPDDQLSFGLAYRSGIRVNQTGTLTLKDIAPVAQALFGGSSFQTGVQTSIDFPEMVSIGVAYRPSEVWTVDIDAEWDGWSSFQSARLHLVKEVPAAGLTDMAVPQNWHDAWAYKVGAAYQLNDQYSIRAGYAFLNTPVPETTLTTANPDANQHNFSVGLGWHQGFWTIDGFYNIGIFNHRVVNNAVQSGEYDTRAQYLGVSTGHRF